MVPLRLVRLLRGLNQRDVAERIGIGQQHYSRLERGVIPMTPGRLAEILGVLTTGNDTKVRPVRARVAKS